jgi:aminoglycoside phosphotransferase (APT) family kinase protein
MDAELEKLKTQVEDYLTKRLGGEATISAMKSLSGGACQDNYLVDLNIAGGNSAGDYGLVLRTDAGAALLSSLGRAEEYRVAKAAFDNGVKTPRPYWLETDLAAIGKQFYFMERIQGKATGRYVVKDRELNPVRKDFARLLAENLAGIHGVTPATADEELRKVLNKVPSANSNEIALIAVQSVRDMLADLPEAHPALELAVNWMERNAPATDSPVLVHGDFRTGNFMVSPEGLHGIVDWEFAHWGDRHEDISWLCMRDWRFGKQTKEVGGFADRSEFYAAYEHAAGHAVDPIKVRFWEIMGNSRWAIGSVQQAERHLSGADKGIQLAAIGRRCCEMEYEVMRLIDHAG